jgi:hypothetical protein
MECAVHHPAGMIRFALPVFLFAACTTTPQPPIEIAACSVQHVDGDVIVCDQAFADRPRVRLPADSLGADETVATIYVALDPQADLPLILRDGRRAVLANASGPITFPYFDDGTSEIPAGFSWFSYRFLETVYEVTGTATHLAVTQSGQVTSVLAIRDAIARPVIRIVPEVLDEVMTGAWEGTLSRRIAANQYDGSVRIPIRVRWTGFAAEHQVIPLWIPSGDPLSYALEAQGVIDNADHAVTLANGTCAPALSSLGVGNPIADSNAMVSMVRRPAMHVPGDYQLVYNGGMGSIGPAHPGAAIQDAERPELTVTSIYPHGTPTGMHLDNFVAVTGGGAACTP